MIDTGNTAWILTSTMLVLLMSIPGIALFYGGLVRQKNVLSIIMQTIFLVAVVSILWVAIGYSWVFDTTFAEKGHPLAFLIGGFGKAFMHGITLDGDRLDIQQEADSHRKLYGSRGWSGCHYSSGWKHGLARSVLHRHNYLHYMLLHGGCSKAETQI